MGRAGARHQATRGKCPEHRMFGCPRTKFLPYKFWEYVFDPDYEPLTPDFYDKYFACIQSKQDLERWIYQQNNPKLEKVEHCSITGQHFRPDSWVERNGEIYMIVGKWFDKRSWDYHGMPGTYHSMGYVKQCVFCDITRGEARRRIDQMFDDVMEDDFPYELVDEDSPKVQFTTVKNPVDCSICMSRHDESVTLKCSHSFCSPCISEWTTRVRNCPLCRDVISTQHDIAFEAETVVETSVAPDAVTVRTRGGRRNRKFIPGLCYLKFIKKSLRDEAERVLGFRPSLLAVDAFNQEHGIVPRGYRVQFVSVGAHVVKHPGWPCSLQWQYFRSEGITRPVGADDDDWTPQDEELLRQMTYPIDFLADYSEAEKEIEESLPRKVPVCIASPGKCWQRLGVQICDYVDVEDPDHVSVDDFLKAYDAYIEDYEFMSWVPFVDFRQQDDGDWHVENVHWSNSMAARDPGHIARLREAFPGYITFDTMLALLRESPRDKLVGSPSVSVVDRATAMITTPDVRSAVEKLVQPTLSNNIEEARRLMPFSVKTELQSKADELACPWSAVQGIPHPHALHAFLRRWALLVELPKYIKCDTTVVGMKDEHFAMLRSQVPDSINLVLVNPIFDHKDIGRFAGRESLSDEVFNLPKIETPGVYFDEQGHYLSGGFIIRLKKDNPGLVSVGYSSIFPLEALEFDQSPEPDYVQWRVMPPEKKGDLPILIYIPEEDYDGKYIQLFDPTPILASRFTDNENIQFNGGVVAGKSHYRIHFFHSFAVLPQKYLVTAEHNYTNLPRPFYDQPDTPPIRTDNLLNLFLYAKVITAKKEDNIAGKLRLFVREKKMYFPPSALNLVIAVVVKMSEIATVPDMMSRDVNSAPEELYKVTVGSLVRVYKRLTTIRRCRKNQKLIDFENPLYVYPMLTIVAKGTNAGDVYGVKWKPAGSIDGNFWRKLQGWLKILGAKMFPKMLYPVTRDGEGNLIFPHLAASEFCYRIYGPRFVEITQKRAFKETYQGVKFEVLKPADLKPVLEEKAVPHANFRYVTKKVTPLGVQHLRENWGDDDSDSEVDSILSAAEETSSGETTPSEAETDTSWQSKNPYKPIVKEMLEKDVWPAVPSEERSETFSNFVLKGGTPSMSEYIKYCTAMRQLKDVVHPEQKRVQEAIIKRTFYRNRIPDETGKTNTFPAQRDIDSARHMEHIDPNVARALKLHRETTLAVIPEMPEPDPEYDKRKDEWERLYQKRPVNATFTHQSSGETYWDVAFRISSDRRYAKVPYSNIIEYPNVNYPENDCVLVAAAQAFKKTTADIYFVMLRAFPREEASMAIKNLPLKVLHVVGLRYNAAIKVVDEAGNVVGDYGIKLARQSVKLKYHNGHLSVIEGVRSLVIERGDPQQQVLKIPPEAQLLKTSLDANPLVQWGKWHPERKRASDLARAYKSGDVGVLEGALNEEKLNFWDTLTDLEAPDIERFLCVIMGDPGCRKSSPIQALLRDKKFRKLGIWIAIMATKALQSDYRDKVDATGSSGGKKLPGDAIPTLDRMLAKDLGAYIGFTDENKYPKGYHALLGFLVPTMKYLVFMCDPWQSSWHNPKPCELNDPSIAGEAEFYMKYAKGYVVGTWRFAGINAAFWRLPSFCKKQCGFHFTDQMPSDHKDLLRFFPKLSEASVFQLWNQRMELFAAHFDTQWAEQLRASDAFSFSGSQGRDAGLVIIEVDERVIRGSEVRLIYTAMTRSQYILFVRKWRDNGRCNADVAAHPVFRVLEHYRTQYKVGEPLVFDPKFSLSIREITFPFPEGTKLLLAGKMADLTNWQDVSQFWQKEDFTVNFVDPNEKRAGARLRRDEEAYRDDPTFQQFIDETEQPEPEDVTVDEFVPQNPRIATTLPVEVRETFVENQNANLIEREDAELQMFGEYSNQFPDVYMLRKDWINIMSQLVDKEPGRSRRVRRARVQARLNGMPKELSPIYVSPQLLNWGANQRNDDAITYAAAARQRIKYATLIENQINYDTQKELGLACWDSFRRYQGWVTPIPWDQDYKDICDVRFQERRGDRSLAFKKGSLNRADMPKDQVQIAIKQQWKMKDRMAKAAKPGQPIMTHSDQYLFEHGSYGIYLLDKLTEVKAPYWYFHAKNTIADYERWNATYMADEPYSEMTDLTGQDGTTQGWALVFFEQLLNWFSFPLAFIEEFVRNKKSKHVRSLLILALMTGSGEIWTLLINSLSACALEVFKFDLPPGVPMAVTGDDGRRRTGYQINPEYRKLAHLDPTIVKRFISPRGEFVSFMSVGPHVFKDPILLLKRFLAKLATGAGDLSVLGYYDLWTWNYNKGESLFSCFTEEEMAAHQIMTRIMFNLKKEGVSVRPDYSRVGRAIQGSELSESIVEMFDLGTLSNEVVDEKGPTNLQDYAGHKQTVPFAISSVIDVAQVALFMA